jgi:hypothetical protein
MATEEARPTENVEASDQPVAPAPLGFEPMSHRNYRFDLLDHIVEQREWSIATFGPHSQRGSDGVIDHLRKEVNEAAESRKLEEWVDIIMLAIDGASREGYGPMDIVTGLANKLEVNKRRQWPDWRTIEPGQAIEHIR